MKFYAAVMVSGFPGIPNTSTNWIEVTTEQHDRIFGVLKKNKELGAEERKL